MKVLITGAKGFVGKNLVATLEAIRDGKDRVREIAGLGEPSQLVIYKYDVDSTPEELNAYCTDCDFVFNLAGVNRPHSPEEFMDGNFGFASTLLDTLKKHQNTCSVMLSSSAQASLEGRYAGSEYGKSKRAGEDLFFEYAKETGAKVLVYRFPNLFGKWCRPNYNSAIATFCHNAANGLPIQINDPSVQMDIVYIDDLVDEMVRALCGSETREGDFCRVPVHYETTLGHLAETIQRFPQIRASLGVPDLSDLLTNKLYATWLSYLPPEGFVYDLKMNADERGSFTEIIRTPDRGQFSVNVSKPGITKGNHWHHTKNEKFLVVKGTALIRLRKVGRDENGNDFPVTEFNICSEKLQVVEMIPGYTHSIVNLSDTEELVTFMWANECFNPSKPDTYFEEV